MCVSRFEVINFASNSRITKDLQDSKKLTEFSKNHNPFPVTDNILSISSGIIDDDKINCYKALEIGLSLMNRIIGGDFGSVKLHKKDKVLSLKAINSSVKIDNEVVTIDPTLIFQRISLNIQSKTDMHKFLEYELAPYSLSLFDEGGMRKGRKSSFYDNFSKISGVSRGPNDFYVVD